MQNWNLSLQIQMNVGFSYFSSACISSPRIDVLWGNLFLADVGVSPFQGLIGALVCAPLPGQRLAPSQSTPCPTLPSRRLRLSFASLAPEVFSPTGNLLDGLLLNHYPSQLLYLKANTERAK